MIHYDLNAVTSFSEFDRHLVLFTLLHLTINITYLEAECSLLCRNMV
jgi:hypothetical protein